jgi:hypothetical protein
VVGVGVGVGAGMYWVSLGMYVLVVLEVAVEMRVVGREGDVKGRFGDWCADKYKWKSGFEFVMQLEDEDSK